MKYLHQRFFCLFCRSILFMIVFAGKLSAAKNAFEETELATVKEMMNAPVNEHLLVHVKGYYTAFDGGGGDFSWDAESTAAADSGLVFGSATVSKGRWRRLLVNAATSLNGKWFGLYADNRHDDTYRLQVLINTALEQGYGVKLPSGNIKVTAPVYIGNTNVNYTGSGFNLEGNGIGVLQKNGTKIILYGQAFPHQGILNFQNQIGIRSTMKYLSVECNTKYSADYGVLWNGTAYTGMMLEYVGVTCAKTAFGIIDPGGKTANGEFTTFYKCFAERTQSYFFMDSVCAMGQAYNHLFIHNSATLIGDYAFQLGSACFGFGIQAIECEFSFTGKLHQPADVPHTYFVNNGITGTMKFSGGRVEGCERLVLSNTHQGTGRCSFENIEFDGMSKLGGNSLIAAKGKGATYTYTWQNCSFNESYKDSVNHSRPLTIDLTQYSNTDRSWFQFNGCTFSGFSYPDIVLRNGLNAGGVKFNDCAWRSDDSTTRARTPVQFFSRQYASQGIFELGARNNITGSATMQAGIPQNLLKMPNLGKANGTVAAPVPWRHAGQSVTLQLFHAPYINYAATQDAFTLKLSANSAIYQDVQSAPLNKQENYITYQALLQNFSEGFSIDLENSVTGKVYDKTTLSGNERDSAIALPQLITLFCMTENDGGFLRLRISNNSSKTGLVYFYNQMVTNLPNGTYVLPDSGTVTTYRNFWGLNIQAARVYGRFSLPYKPDIALPDDSSDLYVSTTTGNLNYSAKGKRWQVPQSFYTDARPAAADYNAGTIAYAKHPSADGIGWVFSGKEWLTIGGGTSDAHNGRDVVYIDPEVAVKEYNFQLPADAPDGKEICIIAGGAIKTGTVIEKLSVNSKKGTIVIGKNPAGVQAGDSFLYRYRAQNNSWYRLN